MISAPRYGAAGGGGGGGLAVSALTVGLDTVTVGTVFGYTATGLTVGAPVFVVIAAQRDTGASSRSISGVTIGGSAATQIFQSTGDPWAGGIYFLAAATSDSMAVSVTFNANMEECVLGHFQITGTAQTTYSARTGANSTTATGFNRTTTPDISIPTDGVGVAMCFGFGAGTAHTWTDSGSDVGVEMLDMDVATGSAVLRVSVYYTDEAGVLNYTNAAGNTSRDIAAFTWGP